MEPSFVTGEPALLLRNGKEKILVVADLHLGIEYEYHQRGIKIPPQTVKATEHIDRLLESTGANRLVAIGDVKHKVPGTSFQELRELPEFFRHFTGRFKVDVAPGNHDGGIEESMPYGVDVHPGSGFRLGEFYFAHGHAWPKDDFMGCKFVIVAHNHPRIEFRDRLGYRWSEPVWMRAMLDKGLLDKRYKGLKSPPELINMPSFNEFVGGMPLNRKGDSGEQAGFLGPLIKNIDISTAKVYMLDGVYLGELEKL